MDALKPLLSRKFLATVLSMVLGVFFVAVGGEAKLEFLKWIVGIYVGGNVAQKFLPEKKE